MNYKDIILSSQIETDKIVFSKEGSVNIASLPDEYNDGYWVVKKLAIPHGMPRPLFIHFRFKIDADTNWRTGGSAEKCIGYSDATNLVILVNNITTGTLYYEVFGSWIDNYDSTNPLVNIVQPASDVLFDSRLNYRKIAKQGMKEILGDGSLNNIPHGLTYTPYYEVYFDGRVGEVWQTHSGGVQDPWAIDNIGGSPLDACDCYARANGTNLRVGGHSRVSAPSYANQNIKIWYRIFGDA